MTSKTTPTDANGIGMAGETRWTPGPWEIGKGIAFCQSIYAGRLNVAFARQDNGHIDAPTAEANARLIASAPELLDALQALVNSFETHRPKQLWDNARAAISRATRDNVGGV